MERGIALSFALDCRTAISALLVNFRHSGLANKPARRREQCFFMSVCPDSITQDMSGFDAAFS
jgi:hypothetical protein